MYFENLQFKLRLVQVNQLIIIMDHTRDEGRYHALQINYN